MFLRKIYKRALSQRINRSDLERIKHAIQLSIISSIACVFIIVLDCLQYKWTNVFVDFFALAFFISPLYLFLKGKFALGKTMIFVAGCIIMAFNASREGRMAGNQFVFLPLFIGPLLLFPKKEMTYMIISWILIFACLVFLEATDYSYFLYPNQDPGLLYVNYLFCFMISLILLVAFVLSFVNITKDSERKLEKLNTQLASNISDLKKANTELDSFVYKASHDLRSPLTSLMGLIELIKNEKDDSTLKYYLSLEEKIVHRLDNYILDILNISRNSRLPVNKEIIDFKEVFDSVFNQLSFHEYASSIQTEVIVEGGNFISDKMRVTILLNNLISNSIRYCDPLKDNHWIKFYVQVSQSHTTISLEDNGIGIQAMHIEKLFQMFYRGTENKSGSGLGLYIVKETVDKLKGEVTVSSEYGQWTKFIITLPNLNS